MVSQTKARVYTVMEKPGKVMESENSNFQAWRNFGEKNKARKVFVK